MTLSFARAVRFVLLVPLALSLGGGCGKGGNTTGGAGSGGGGGAGTSGVGTGVAGATAGAGGSSAAGGAGAAGASAGAGAGGTGQSCAAAGMGGAIATAGAEGAAAGTGGTAGAPSGAAGAGTDAGSDAGSTAATDAGATTTDGAAGASATDAAVAEGGVVGTAARPQLTSATAASYTILQTLARWGSLVAGLSTDNWNPTAGVGDVSTFTPTYTVAACGGTHPTVQAAIDAATAAGGTNRVYILVTPGTYREVVCIKSAAPPITLYSTEPDATKTVIVNNNYNGKVVTSPITGAPSNPCAASVPPALGAPYGTSGSATFAAYAQGFQAKNLTLANDLNEAGLSSGLQAVALTIQADKVVLENVRLLGNQDTLYVKTGNADTVARSYFKGCYVEGDVDYIFGRATMVFDGCEIKYISTRRGGASGGDIISPSTDTRNSYGMLFVNSTFTADSGTATGSVALGRAWDESQVLTMYPPAAAGYPNGQALIRDCVLGKHISNTAPWQAAASTARPFSATAGPYPANRLWEFANSGPGAAP